ncbi:mRNA cleavage and polyadenylation factor I complex, subunit RNA15 [Pseudoloma neurophilia]|uniref:mRNA cleavage and polyadenylation factor I complex, subunit RNA15 n=1 Tax=Pseudoloma neurophilia TaxID=146866 RepID=A0A0R0LT01_9MICR|nr:mRNA cleavage and polyadenylation factor I complex, subunit RNA15 [Pseudoloma neurophilia]
MSNKKTTPCQVFVGNIDFGATQEDLIRELGKVGKVLSFRFVIDKNGKSKGYGFAEYENATIANLAVRTLDISFNGRPVKINYAENDMKVASKINSVVLEDVLKNMDETNLYDCLKYLKQICINDTAEIKKLMKNEQFSNFLISALYKLNLLNEDNLCELIARGIGFTGTKEELRTYLERLQDDDIDELDETIKEKVLLMKGLLMNKISR